MSQIERSYEPVTFADLPGWDTDDHAAALAAFQCSAQRLLDKAAVKPGSTTASPGLLVAAGLAAKTDPASARAFFETNFKPHRVAHNGPGGLLTGYYEPIIPGARERTEHYAIPLYNRPADLVNLVAESERGAMAHQYTHMRKTAAGQEPYATRADIENGALAGQGLEVFWLHDPVDVFFLHVQGSGVIALPDGSSARVAYDGKNGHPYTSIGRYLIDEGLFPADQMTLDALKDWLRANPELATGVLQQNKSFVFFRELMGDEAGSPVGVEEIPLTPGRSLAVDTGFHAIGSPVYVVAPTLTHATGAGGFHRLMVAQDVGSAIRGPERGDLYFGTGDEAGRLAGNTKHPGTFYVLLAGTPQ
ncbi:MAG: MltA domain-containing protein [Hyphomicrobiaceae bacterium]|nr:MltA domain-containing protein [Hyphomicrobiaceae bacterium]